LTRSKAIFVGWTLFGSASEVCVVDFEIYIEIALGGSGLKPGVIMRAAGSASVPRHIPILAR